VAELTVEEIRAALRRNRGKNNALGRLDKLLGEHRYEVTLDGGERERFERYRDETALPQWYAENEPGTTALTDSEVMHSLVTAALEAEERKAGLVGRIDGSVVPREQHFRERAEREAKRDGR
jgi:hypothetical protein